MNVKDVVEGNVRTLKELPKVIIVVGVTGKSVARIFSNGESSGYMVKGGTFLKDLVDRFLELRLNVDEADLFVDMPVGGRVVVLDA